MDKEFFLTSKIIDLLVEPIAHESGVDLYENRGARQIAYDFHSLGPRSFSSTDWDRLKEAFNSLARINQRAGGKVTVDEFMNLLGDLRFKCRRRRMQEIIELLLRSRQHAASIAQQIPSMDPLFAGIPATAYEWFHRLRVPLQIVHDEQNALTSERISQMVSTLTGKHDLSKYAPPIKIASFELADSKTDVRLQLADIAAGVVRVYAEHIIQPVGQPEVSLPVQSIQRLILNDSVTSSQEDYTQLTGRPGG
ncbi:hypothetical protein [Nakamurella multipartita]|uniref:hypothetical protein n=1 Tax=Nakamurella multipartita TaxID=53461 RepID=UPI0010FD5FCE|nr:hypothetical protein [Nakamurella multipartita]